MNTHYQPIFSKEKHDAFNAKTKQKDDIATAIFLTYIITLIMSAILFNIIN